MANWTVIVICVLAVAYVSAGAITTPRTTRAGELAVSGTRADAFHTEDMKLKVEAEAMMDKVVLAEAVCSPGASVSVRRFRPVRHFLNCLSVRLRRDNLSHRGPAGVIIAREAIKRSPAHPIRWATMSVVGRIPGVRSTPRPRRPIC